VTERVRTGTDAQGNGVYETVSRIAYIDGWIDSSFVGIMPATDPELVTLILLHRPATWGRYQIAQRPDDLFRDVAPRILDYLAIPPDRPTDPVATW
jgi:hypothetical protein